METFKKVIYFFGIENSVIDEKEKCIRVLVEGGDSYFDIGNLDQTHRNIEKKYPNFKFTGKQKIVDVDKNTQELLFFYE